MNYLHAGATVPDLERSKRVYGDLRGLKEIERPDLGFPGAWDAIGDSQLHLMVPPPDRPAGDPDPQFTGRVRHIAVGALGGNVVELVDAD